MLRCESIVPFGLPVVPLEHGRIATASSAGGGAAGGGVRAAVMAWSSAPMLSVTEETRPAASKA